MKNRIVCPGKCSGGYWDRVKTVQQLEAGITPKIARAAGLSPNERVSFCWHCHCVWKETDNLNLRGTQTVVLGEYDDIAFQPKPWLEQAIVDLEKQHA